MSTDPRESIRRVGTTVGTLAVQFGLLALAGVVFPGLGFLVYRQRIEPDVLLFSAGVILGVLSKAFIDSVLRRDPVHRPSVDPESASDVAVVPPGVTEHS